MEIVLVCAFLAIVALLALSEIAKRSKRQIELLSEIRDLLRAGCELPSSQTE
ncbi:MAG: hypothetical protein HY721_08625 [Planctomycetes bacterium]|nr:hypothetical protein [Planctomycetota bacterium]